MAGMAGDVLTSVFYDDGDRVSCKTGKVIEKNKVYISLEVFDGKKITIPFSRVVRIEEVAQ